MNKSPVFQPGGESHSRVLHLHASHSLIINEKLCTTSDDDGKVRRPISPLAAFMDTLIAPKSVVHIVNDNAKSRLQARKAGVAGNKKGNERWVPIVNKGSPQNDKAMNFEDSISSFGEPATYSIPLADALEEQGLSSPRTISKPTRTRSASAPSIPQRKRSVDS
eukprot:scaffold276_cov132-Cylindrotheca_fusiformis.AAC.9